MGTKQENIHNKGAETNKKKTETKSRHQAVEAIRVSIGMLDGVFHEMDNVVQNKITINRTEKKEDANAKTTKKEELGCNHISSSKPTSMSSLIIWNISKALELNPYMDLKSSLKEADARLTKETRDLNTVLAQYPEQQHLVCALLAWQQLGNKDPDSLYKFIESKRNETQTACSTGCSSKSANKEAPKSPAPTTLVKQNCCNQTPAPPKPLECGSFGSHSSGPVVKLPVETKVIMRMDTSPPRQVARRCHEMETLNKINAACCMDSACAERLAALDNNTKELRTRASKLAQREAERVELLERAETAWKDLEVGYQRRLTLAEEKEDDINKQVEKLVTERNGYKNTCTELAQQLKDRGDIVANERAKLTEVEKKVCDRACIKLRLNEECARGEAALAEHQCRAAQLERDLQFKEEQARRKLFSLENEADSARALTHEAERAMRGELSALREQIGQVSEELLKEDEQNVKIKEELDKLRKQKMDMVEDLEGCKTMCDAKMQGRVDELQRKRDAISMLKTQLMECQCKVPVDETVEVKRTPSLAALCRCAPEDRLLESCSCTSLRGRLLSNLLADLFGGLQTELGGTGSQMPCQLLKCLEDKHNWDRASVVKTNLRNFFSKLLMGELDIAIATAIENYHAKWVGASCADASKMAPDPEDQDEGWQQRALEKRAQKLATQLAEQLFQERAEQLAQRAKEIVTSGPPPCDCKPQKCDAAAAVYPCLVQSTGPPFSGGTTIVNRQSSETPAYWKRTIQDVTQLRLQIEDLKKESIKKEDLKLMEEKIAKIVKQVSGTENDGVPSVMKDTPNYHGENIKKETKFVRSPLSEESPKNIQNKSVVSRRKIQDSNSILKKSSLSEKPTKQCRKPSHSQAYAVNLCLCGPQKNSKQVQNTQMNNDGKSSWKQKLSKDIIPHSSSIKQTKPINVSLPSPDMNEINNKASLEQTCNSECKCFRKVPSNTSIDKLLETLTKWKCDLADPQERCIKNIKSSLSKYCKTTNKDSTRDNKSYDSNIGVSISTLSQNEFGNDFRCLRKKVDGITQSAPSEQPATTESEYMGAVNLDKSNENICKCIIKAETSKENNQEKNANGNNNAPIKCINSNACECKIYQHMQKDNKKSQTVEQNNVVIFNQIQGVQTIDTKDVVEKNTSTKDSSNENRQKEMEKLSDTNNSVAEKSKLFPNSCEYYIKFLGVTLADLSSNKKSKSMIKNASQNNEDVIIAKDKYVDQRRKRQKKLSDIDTSNSISKQSVTPIEVKESINKTKYSKCECNARFDELKHFMSNIFTRQLQSNTYKDEGLDSQSFKCNENNIDSCICSTSVTGDNSKDLEVNAFHLLEDHLKGKLEEFKSFSCKSSCIPPEEEERLFSAILKRVKQVISDCANEMKCSCPGGVPADGSWNRAYGLLQEYLKIKINRVQCLCVFNDNKDAVLPEILEKVCNLIENDFQRLKDICKCKNNNGTRKKTVRIEDIMFNAKELPEKDTNVTKYDIVEVQTLDAIETLSKQNSNKSMILTENISSQVPPNLGMDTKSCDVMQPEIKNVQTTETDVILTENKSNGAIYNSCDCCYNTDDEKDKGQFTDIFGTKEVLVNLYTNAVKTSSDIFKLSNCTVNQRPSRFMLVGRTDSMKTIPDVETIAGIKSKLDIDEESDKKNENLPYIGYTVDCSCDSKLGSCVCTKSIVKANNDKIDNVYKEFLANVNNCNPKFSYIMHGTQNKDNDVMVKYQTKSSDVLKTGMSNGVEQIENKIICETEVSAQNEEEIVLKNSRGNLNAIHHTTNTYGENVSLGSNGEGPLDWFECPVPITSEERVSNAQLPNSVNYPVPINDYKKFIDSNTGNDTSTMKIPQTCDCDRVPICHVKMLVENIEKNLIESKCTCDSLIPKLCPVHSKQTS